MTTPAVLKLWTGDGVTREYVQNVPELLGLEYETYKTGNVRWASLDGAAISNAEANRILAVRAWRSPWCSGLRHAVHVQGADRVRALDEDTIRDRIQAGIDAMKGR
jgi:hypothetical protein